MLQILICQYKDFKTNIVPDLISFTQHGMYFQLPKTQSPGKLEI